MDRKIRIRLTNTGTVRPFRTMALFFPLGSLLTLFTRTWEDIFRSLIAFCDHLSENKRSMRNKKTRSLQGPGGRGSVGTNL